MEVTRRRRKLNKVVIGSLVELYPHDLQLYIIPPMSSILLSEFEDLALERLKVLRIMEQINHQGQAKSQEEWKVAVVTEMKKQGLKSFAKLVTGSGCGHTEAELQARKRDHISHFILRLAYCRSEELRRWFIGRELELFRLRFHSLSTEGIKMFLQENNLDYIPISEEEKNRLKENLVASTFNATPTSVETLDFFKVPFTEVLDLVRNRKVYLAAGYAYIPSTDFVSVIQSIFRANLSHALVLTARQLPLLEEDERLHKFLGGLHHSYTGEEYCLSKDKTGVSPEQLDSLSKISFPLCMRQIHESIRTTHHARHGGRMQYGLFLKGIGVSMDDSLRFWREEFTKIMDLDKFEKQYSYLIRHNYGREGKRTNYTPYSCMKIIMGSIGPGDHHGCPFRHNDLAALKQQMHSYSLPPLGIQEVADYVTRGHYQLACAKYFEISHGVPADSGINHPNQYFEESQKAIAAKHGIKTEPVSVEMGGTGEPILAKPTVNPDNLWDGDFDVSSLNTVDSQTAVQVGKDES